MINLSEANRNFSNEIVAKIGTDEMVRPQPTNNEKKLRKKVGGSYFMVTGKKEYLLVR